MKRSDSFSLRGELELIHRDFSGSIKKRETIDNLIVNHGREYVAKRLVGLANFNPVKTIRIGTGTNAAAVTDTALQTEVQSKVATVTYEADYKCKADATFSFSTATQVREAGLFQDHTSPPNMISRVNISYDMEPGDTLQIIWRLHIS